MSSRKGRMFPSSLSRSQPFSRLPLAAKALYPLLMANADDQGRQSADPQMLKWNVCPNVEEIPVAEIPHLLETMASEHLVCVYQDEAQLVLQLCEWWKDQSAMQWAYPSDYLPNDGWDDRLRFRNQGRVITINWPRKANGTKVTPLSELVIDPSFSRSLPLAIQKALGSPAPTAIAGPAEEPSIASSPGPFRA